MNSPNDKWAFIVNPVAGNDFASGYAEEVKNKVKKYDIKAELFFTERQGHASDITSECIKKDFNHFIAVGGDGTINEIMKKLVGKPELTLGVITAGTGNDMIQILGFSGKFSEKDWDIFFERNTIKMDVGNCNGNYFLNGMGIGFDAKVASENYTKDGHVIEDQGSKYLWHILKNLFFYKETEMDSEWDGEKHRRKFFLNTISVGRRFAGKYFLTPKAIANDGLLDMCIVGELGVLERFKIFLKVPKGEHLEHKKVDYYRAKHIKIEMDKVVPHHLDGELFFASSFDISIIPGGLNIIYNPAGPHFFNTDK
jgi:YegS/Rv2252/BmrU family lipid kinase